MSEGRVFVVTPYVDSPTLRQHLTERATLSVSEARPPAPRVDGLSLDRRGLATDPRYAPLLRMSGLPDLLDENAT